MNGEVKEAELIDTALVPTDAMAALVKESDKPVYNAMSSMNTLDWHDLKPNQTALLLMAKPLQVSGGGVMYLNFKQALYFAVRAYELGVSPFSSGVWFDPQRYSVNLTLEGKKEVARNRGIDLGPPNYEEILRDWNMVPRSSEAAEAAKKMGFAQDIGIRCKMRVGDPKNQEFVTYTAYLSEWLQPKSPVWASKPIHMLTTRATEKAISLVLGTGASSMPDEKELE